MADRELGGDVVHGVMEPVSVDRQNTTGENAGSSSHTPLAALGNRPELLAEFQTWLRTRDEAVERSDKTKVVRKTGKNKPNTSAKRKRVMSDSSDEFDDSSAADNDV